MIVLLGSQGSACARAHATRAPWRPGPEPAPGRRTWRGCGARWELPGKAEDSRAGSFVSVVSLEVPPPSRANSRM